MLTRYFVTYDICDDKRLRRVFKTLRNYGDHVQFSVFDCTLTEKDLVILRAALTTTIDPKEDQVLLIRLGPADGNAAAAVVALGVPITPVDRVVTVL